ncbi:MAG: glycerol-3-phosphate 1-O-acyltransferase PlsY [Acidaminococcaceae bacterium]|nr:glycerol-3-phosphate 1-O-acyltransferase PlsY [Acidaminococcaceae bacterium]
MSYVIGAIIGYVLGSIPCGFVFVKLICGIDIRQYGSKNIGTTNVFRTVGARMASFVLLGDMFKGILAIILVKYFFAANLHLELVTAIAVLLGHNYSVFLGFKGGRGVATGLGLILYFMPDVSIFAFSVWLAIVFVTKYVSLASVLAAFLTPMASYYRGYPLELVAFATAACVFVIIRHYENIKRLIGGTETKIKQGSLDNIKKKTSK